MLASFFIAGFIFLKDMVFGCDVFILLPKMLGCACCPID